MRKIVIGIIIGSLLTICLGAYSNSKWDWKSSKGSGDFYLGQAINDSVYMGVTAYSNVAIAFYLKSILEKEKL